MPADLATVTRLHGLRRRGDMCGPYWAIPPTQSESDNLFGPSAWTFMQTVLAGGTAAQQAWDSCEHASWMLWLARKCNAAATSDALFETTVEDDVAYAAALSSAARCDIVRKYLKCPNLRGLVEYE